MAPVRLRHPKGVSTIEVLLDAPDFTILDLQQEIYATTNILPSRQILKAGYPPRQLTIVPDLPLQALGLQRGDQIIVNEASSDQAPPPQSQSSSVPARSPLAPAPTQTYTAPAPIPRSVPVQPSPPVQSSGPDSVEVDGSFLVHRIVPDDNSCLFSSVALVFEQSISKAQQIRKIVADGIRNNPETYNEAILGMPPSQYIATITKPTSWGGAIELSIIAAHYSAEIASIDVETGRIDHFSPGEHGAASGMRAILIYSGIHYDAATLAPMADAPDEWHQTLFPILSGDDNSDPILVAAKKLADILRSKKAFTNTSTFDLRCEGLKGEKGARAHAEQTGHVRFGEY
ncbi:Putative ubiquitin thioesterase otu1 [Psilocybe cubensis]|uniref:Ubiquitin thioesterase otu1 n=2 Tax=Psilocybe cubensis TaxID=181762 RepID=A0ACB8H7L7_PSICU|nr:Putative ubiquitin thioesterase otu1 [Psilocybe cubensis]KAH9483705.1 Putative ubiquitin thioesterase otu1 [Psilocybe cubensis]